MNSQEHVDLPADLQEQYDSAKKVLESNGHHVIIDDVYPWWKTFRKPIVIMSIKDVILCLAIIFLSISVATLLATRTEQDKLDECYQQFTNASSEATAEVRAAATRVDSAGWSALVNSANGEEVTDAQVQHVDDLIGEADIALMIDQLRLQQREEWVKAGRPMPEGRCPLPGTPAASRGS